MNANIFRPTAVFEQPFWETVTLLPRVPPGAEPISGYVLYRAKREDTKKANVDPALKKKMLDWIVFQADLDNAGAPQPKVKDVVQDSSLNNWSVMQVDTELVSNAYVLTTLAEVS